MNILNLFLVFFIIVGRSESDPNKCNTTTPPRGPAPEMHLMWQDKNFTADFYNFLEVNCSAYYPVQWSFIHHPRWKNTRGDFNWNVSYFRVADDVFEESQSQQTFLTLLTFSHVTPDLLAYLGPSCASVSQPCLSTNLSSLLNLTAPVVVGEGAELGGGGRECNLDLWFQPNSHLFFCQARNDSVLPQISFSYCANPTHCGLSVSTACESQSQPHNCTTGSSNCAKLNVGAEFPIPKIIYCSSHNSSVRHMGYFHSLRHPYDSYVNWEEADPTELLSIQSSKVKVMANESVDVVCEASYFYFSGGLHFTLKRVSDPAFSTIYLHELLPPFSVSKLKETFEYWNDKRGDKPHTQPLPLKRTLLAYDLLLPHGEYEVTCYAPVWNTTHWISKSVIVTVANTSIPLFLGGNGTSKIQFESHKNLTCLARGIPPPKLTWMYSRERLEAVDVGGESASMSWSVLTLPENIEGVLELEIKCHADNVAGFNEKLFIVSKNDASLVMSTRIAAFVVLLGFVGNVIVFFFCWKKLFADDDGHEEHREFRAVKFLRHLWSGEVSWCRFRGGTSAASAPKCQHPKCRQRTQAV